MVPLYWLKWFYGIIEIGGHPIPKGAGNGQSGFRPIMAISGISRHSFPAPIGIRKKMKMPIRQNIKALKEAPAKAMQIAIVALFIAITALMVSLGKK